MTRWWETFPARWEQEQQALRAEGIEFRVDESAKKSGRIVLDLTWLRGDQPIRLVAHFPTAYPYFPPMVVAPDLHLARHQAPGGRNLCLIKRDDWELETDTLASLLTDQFPRIFAAQPGESEEQNQGQEAEPLTAYLQTEANSFVGFPAYDIGSLPESGTFRFGIESIQTLRGTVLEVLDDSGKRLFTSEVRDATYYNARKLPVLTGRWVRLAVRPGYGDAKHFQGIAESVAPKFATPAWQFPPSKAWRIDLVALLFGDELTWQASAGNAILVSRTQDLATAANKKSAVMTRLHRVELEGRSNYFQRDTMSAGLQDGCVALVGVGSVGSPAAKLLAQAGVGELRLMDHDVLDAGNAIRWELGRAEAGYPKVNVLHRLIEANWPLTKVTSCPWKVGDAIHASEPKESELFDLLTRNVSCMFDATGSTITSHFLSVVARQKGIPFVWMHGTNGGWGGLVGRAGSNPAEFCWKCHLFYLADKTIPPLRAAPEADKIQPPGCLDATFIGSQVDLMEVALMGTRVVVDEVLTKKGKQANPRYDWNVAVLELRDEKGLPILPKWTPYVLPRHPKCADH
jgi:hypothetical protein